jgi:hypothetical protein
VETPEHRGEVVRPSGPLAAEVTAILRLLGSSFAENATLRKEVESLHAQVDARDLLQQAQGIIMGRLDISAEAALQLLTAGAGPDDKKLGLIAAAVIVARRTPAEIAADVLREAQDTSPEPPQPHQGCVTTSNNNHFRLRLDRVASSWAAVVVWWSCDTRRLLVEVRHASPSGGTTTRVAFWWNCDTRRFLLETRHRLRARRNRLALAAAAA